MLVSIAPHALPARGMQHCCSSGRVNPQRSINKGYVEVSRRRCDFSVLALGPLGHHSAPDVFDGLETEMARMQRSFQRMEDQVQRCRGFEASMMALLNAVVLRDAHNADASRVSRA